MLRTCTVVEHLWRRARGRRQVVANVQSPRHARVLDLVLEVGVEPTDVLLTLLWYAGRRRPPPPLHRHHSP